VSRFQFGSQQVGTPSVRVTPTVDIALSVLALPEAPGEPATIRVTIQPLIVWLWIGGGVMALGTLLAAAGGWRRHTPVSAGPVSSSSATGGSSPPDPDLVSPAVSQSTPS
jgi:cytochrome c-type biogenesis protein CcmF